MWFSNGLIAMSNLVVVDGFRLVGGFWFDSVVASPVRRTFDNMHALLHGSAVALRVTVVQGLLSGSC